MLRASSLRPILSSTFRILLEQCPQYKPARQERATLTRLASNQVEYGDAYGVSQTVHASSSVENTAQKDVLDSENENTGQSNLDAEHSPLVRYMLDREKEAWKAEKIQDNLYVRQELPYITGTSPHSSVLPPLYGGKFKYGSSYKKTDQLSASMLYPDMDVARGEHEVDAQIFTPHEKLSISNQDLYYHLCHVIANTTAVEDAWTAYSTILTIPPPKERRQGDPPIPFQHLHRLCRLLAKNRPRTRTQFLRLLSVLYSIRKHGGKVHQFEWNSLIANAGTGWRGSKAQDFKLALDVFEDMVSGNQPGSSFSPSDYPTLGDPPQPVEPDIYTYNILISIAAKTLYGRAIGRASAMLYSSGHAPDRITHLSLLVFFSHTRQLSGVRSTLLKMRQQNLELGLDGINACIWAYGYNGKLEWVDNIYRVLRHNTHPEPEETIRPVIEEVKDEFINISPHMMPNAVTFSTVIQIMAYNGYLTKTYNVLMDMLSSFNMEPGAPLVQGEGGKIHYTTYAAVYASFRSLFLGFSRHGIYLRNDYTARIQDRKWTISNLQAIFDTFIGLPEPIRPSANMVYWIMVAFDRTSDHNVELMRKVWKQLEEQFMGTWGGPQHRLRALRDILFSSDAEEHLREYGFHVAKRDLARAPFTYQQYNPDS